MPGSPLAQILLLLGSAVVIVLFFQRLRIPSVLAYLLIGVLLGPHTAGPVVDAPPLLALAEFGIVFLLFTIGLNFSLPQIHALRHMVLGLGTAQVALTTVAVSLIGWAAGLAPAAAFVVGAVFAQSSTTIISRQLAEQSEEHGRHARLGVAMSVFQDVTAVPFVVVIPVLATAGAVALGTALAWALAKAALALVLVVFVGRWLLRPLFHVVAARRSAELFTLTVLFVTLAAGATTHGLGLSMAFGAFLAGMVLGDTEFRHQVETTIRPLRDVLLGLFFVGIGMLVDPAALARVWPWGLLGAALLLVVKCLLVAGIVRRAGVDWLTAWRTGMLLAVGGEFGFALLALGLQAQVLSETLAQIVLASVLFSMLGGPLLIRFNHALALRLAPRTPIPTGPGPQPDLPSAAPLAGHVLLAGYGRIGQSLGHLLEAEGQPWAALDLDAERVREARLAGQQVHYGDGAQIELLEALGLAAARLVVITHDDSAAALKTLQQIRAHHPGLPVMVRTRDLSAVDALRAAGATEVFPETLEAGLMIASQALLTLGVPLARVLRQVRSQRAGHYRQLRELFPGDATHASSDDNPDADRLHALRLPEESIYRRQSLSALPVDGVVITALVRAGQRRLQPAPDTLIEGGDTLVLFGPPEALARVEASLLA
ncbi:MAG: cation:proton antiporter [Gammaproteobacteria bacterium]|uniref:monovalent cation:proton antiporter family protein n=1 Tax=Rhodoferax sp. TaxID=50421 RepID=UPI0017FEB80C|nr:monovalent cation:proton antiporter family protein [Rhodoferax sp.]MBU3900980.1 cation:proton antiporter [Gammaproteobacteria bacterium]MBA3058328.1 sodium:proton exchanger [Rhodoferax sp.]MBU3996791.1 cation:proton antiporter [Gammaproteobacteria bacterium]MBU4017654.1 cation:proton antiporter [Gammaproteobacteria bacterium]MBU4081097.1 cation:proton antiporter [Gammaproteobacteria bacterium]